MTKIEQLNWARQILAATPGTAYHAAEVASRLTREVRKLNRKIESLTLERDNARARLRQYQHKLAESEKQNEVLEARDRVLSGKLRREMDDASLLRVGNGRLARQAAEQEIENKRLKKRVNELVRKINGEVAA